MINYNDCFNAWSSIYTLIRISSQVFSGQHLSKIGLFLPPISLHNPRGIKNLNNREIPYFFAQIQGELITCSVQKHCTLNNIQL